LFSDNIVGNKVVEVKGKSTSPFSDGDSFQEGGRALDTGRRRKLLAKVLSYAFYYCDYKKPKLKLKLNSVAELYRPSDRHLSAKLVPTFADGGCHVANVTDPYGCILGFLDRRRYFFFQVAPQLYSRG
jgi:hypothetical protein